MHIKSIIEVMGRPPHLVSAADLVVQSVVRLTEEPEVSGSIPGPAIYFRGN